MKTARIITLLGYEQAPCFFESKGLAVTKLLGMYSVTHKKTGRAIRGAFFKESAAIGFCKAIADMHPWKAVKIEWKKGEAPKELVEKVTAAWDQWQKIDDGKYEPPKGAAR